MPQRERKTIANGIRVHVNLLLELKELVASDTLNWQKAVVLAGKPAEYQRRRLAQRTAARGLHLMRVSDIRRLVGAIRQSTQPEAWRDGALEALACVLDGGSCRGSGRPRSACSWQPMSGVASARGDCDRARVRACLMAWTALILGTSCSLLVPGPGDLRRGPDDGGSDGGMGESDAGPVDAGTPDGGTDAGGCSPACSGDTPFCDGEVCVQCTMDEHCDDGVLCTVDRCGLDGMCRGDVDPACIADVTAGVYFSCAVRGDGTALCWGQNDFGQLGDGMMTTRPMPELVATLSMATEISAGYTHACALRSTGDVSCWGSNSAGALGRGTTGGILPWPGPVGSLSDARALAAGAGHSCVIREDTTAMCWGVNNRGQIGDGSMMDRSSPTAVLDLTGATQIDAGQGHTCALRNDGTVVCWGYNASGQLGDTTMVSASRPVEVSALDDASQLAIGFTHSCVIQGAGSVACWGENGDGQLGDGSMVDSSVPVAVPGIGDAVQIDAGAEHTCVVHTTGAVSCWGSNAVGELGNGMTGGSSAMPVAVLGLDDAVRITTGWGHTCARRETGAVVCWGANSSGQLGDGTTMGSNIPVAVDGL